MAYLVKNVNGSSRFGPPSGYSSWLEYWEDQSGYIERFCHCVGCIGTDLVGAHVQKAGSTDRKWYIVPLCQSCNKKSTSFMVEGPLVPVPSNL